MNVVRDALLVFTLAAFVYYAILNGFYLFLTALAWRETAVEVRRRTYSGLDEMFRSPLTPGISVLVAAFNEQAVIVESVRSLMTLRYPLHEVVIVNDGSTDATIDVLIEAFDLVKIRMAVRDTVPSAPIRGTYASRRHPNLLVVDKENGGRSDALNAALMVARHPYVCVIDADSLLEEDALMKVAKPILDDPALVVASSGTIRIANDCRVDHGRVVEVGLPKNRLAIFQVLEYFRAFLVARVGWSRLNALGLISGAFGLFHRQLVETVGGYWTGTVGEDLELTLRLHRHLRDRDEPYRIAFVADPVCWTEVPEQFATLARQRRRWQRGLWEGLYRHRRMILNPHYGPVGLISMPCFALFEFLSPLFSLGGLAVTIVLLIADEISVAYFVAFLIISSGLGALLTTAALVVEEYGFQRYRRRRDMVRLFVYAVLENFGFHQLHDFWRAIGYVDIMRGATGWGAQQRRGFGSPSKADVAAPAVDD